eukprot:scaffold7116_cov296-Pinguiococcus_pyrenoidosus.AAC.13
MGESLVGLFERIALQRPLSAVGSAVGEVHLSRRAEAWLPHPGVLLGLLNLAPHVDALQEVVRKLIQAADEVDVEGDHVLLAPELVDLPHAANVAALRALLAPRQRLRALVLVHPSAATRHSHALSRAVLYVVAHARALLASVQDAANNGHQVDLVVVDEPGVSGHVLRGLGKLRQRQRHQGLPLPNARLLRRGP